MRDSNVPDAVDFDLIIMKADVDDAMYSKLKEGTERLKSKANQSTLFIVLETPGGIPMYAYRAMQFLGRQYEKIYSIIPDASMSAGTLMALGTDAIGMLPGSCLGPLDLQVEHPDDDRQISTLDIRDTASSTSLEASVVARKILIDSISNGIPKRMAERLATSIVSAMYTPIMDKIDPYRMHESVRNAEVGAKYGARLLISRMMAKRKRQASEISSNLANSYSYHGYAITYAEAEEMGLVVFRAEDLSVWRQILDFYKIVPAGSIMETSITANSNKDEERK